MKEKELTAESYVRYLRMYARRFGLDSTMKLGCSVVKVAHLSTPAVVCGEDEGAGGNIGGSKGGILPLSDLWEIQYSYNNNDGVRELAVLYSKFIVVACGKAQIPIIDDGLTEALKGFSGERVYAKDVKDIEGTWTLNSAITIFLFPFLLQFSPSINRTPKKIIFTNLFILLGTWFNFLFFSVQFFFDITYFTFFFLFPISYY
jgi:hypothetical protein